MRACVRVYKRVCIIIIDIHHVHSFVYLLENALQLKFDSVVCLTNTRNGGDDITFFIHTRTRLPRPSSSRVNPNDFVRRIRRGAVCSSYRHVVGRRRVQDDAGPLPSPLAPSLLTVPPTSLVFESDRLLLCTSSIQYNVVQCTQYDAKTRQIIY